MPPPLEQLLMKKFAVRYREAHQVVVDARQELNMPDRGPWTQDLFDLCVRRIEKPKQSKQQDLDESTASTASLAESLSNNSQHSSSFSLENNQQQQHQQSIAAASLPAAAKPKPSAPRSDKKNFHAESLGTDPKKLEDSRLKKNGSTEPAVLAAKQSTRQQQQQENGWKTEIPSLAHNSFAKSKEQPRPKEQRKQPQPPPPRPINRGGLQKAKGPEIFRSGSGAAFFDSNESLESIFMENLQANPPSCTSTSSSSSSLMSPKPKLSQRDQQRQNAGRLDEAEAASPNQHQQRSSIRRHSIHGGVELRREQDPLVPGSLHQQAVHSSMHGHRPGTNHADWLYNNHTDSVNENEQNDDYGNRALFSQEPSVHNRRRSKSSCNSNRSTIESVEQTNVAKKKKARCKRLVATDSGDLLELSNHGSVSSRSTLSSIKSKQRQRQSLY